MVFSLIVCLASAPPVWAGTKTVKRTNDCAGDLNQEQCSIQTAITNAAAGDTIYVLPSTMDPPYNVYEPITITKSIKLIGLTSTGQQAWASGLAGASSSGPTIKQITQTDHIIKIENATDVTIAGFNLEGRGATVTGTALYGNVNKITLTYNTFNIGQKLGEVSSKRNKAKGISVDNGANAYNLNISNCKFIGETTNTSNWFYVGNYGTGGSIGNVLLSNNSIKNAMASFLLSTNRPITCTQILNNTFENAWIGTPVLISPERPLGYIYFDEPSENSDEIIRGITITHNTFQNGTASVDTHEFAFVVSKNVEENNVSGSNWEANVALHANNFLQNDAGSEDYPIVGFQNESPSHVTEISATTNYWGSGAAGNSGPRLFSASGTDTTRADVSSYVRYKPWARAEISGGTYAELLADTINEITGTQMLKSNMYLQIKTVGGSATIIPTKYSGPVTGTSLTNGIAYFDLGIKSGGENINAITATFYTRSPEALSSPYLRFFDGKQWVDCSSFMRKAITPTSTSFTLKTEDVSNTYVSHTFNGAVTYVITATKNYVGRITPTLWAITQTSIHTPTRTFFTLVGTGGSSATTSSTTTTTTSGGSTTSSSSSSTSSTSTSTTSVKPTTTTVQPTTTSTTTSIGPKLSVSPSSLSFGDNDTAKQITIANSGAGTLTWRIKDNETTYNEGKDWVFTASPKSGSITSSSQSVTVLVNRSGISAGSYSASLPILSNGGTKNLSVSMSVAQQELPLPLISNKFLVFNVGETEKTFTIRNISSGSLTWEIGDIVYNRSKGWLKVSPELGYARTDTDTVKVTVNPENEGKGFYSATIPVRTNAGTVNVNVVMLIQEGPVAKVQPAILFFLRKTDTKKGFSITNTGSGTLSWSISSPEYKGGNGWIKTLSPTSGTTETDPSVVTVEISRDGLISGLYRADIPIVSNGGNKKVIVLMLVTPF